LLYGAARHGVGRTDLYYLNDPELSFREILRRHIAGEPLLDPAEKLAYKNSEKKIKAESEPPPLKRLKSDMVDIQIEDIKGEMMEQEKRRKDAEDASKDKELIAEEEKERALQKEKEIPSSSEGGKGDENDKKEEEDSTEKMDTSKDKETTEKTATDVVKDGNIEPSEDAVPIKQEKPDYEEDILKEPKTDNKTKEIQNTDNDSEEKNN